MTSIEIAKNITKKYKIEVSLNDLEHLTAILTRKELVKGEVLLDQGQIAKELIYVESGMLRQFYYKKGIDVTEHFTCGGDTLAYCITSLFTMQPTSLMIEALESSVIYTISYEKMKLLSFRFPTIAKLHINILEYGLVLSQQKADSWRFETARERYEKFIKEYPQVAGRASVNHIASYLLMAPESLSRVRAGNL